MKKRRENRREKKKKKRRKKRRRNRELPSRNNGYKGKTGRVVNTYHSCPLCHVVCRVKDRVVQPMNILHAVHYTFPVQ